VTLPLAQQVAQMVVVRASGHLFDHQIAYPAWEPTASTLQHWIQNLGVGGVLLLGGSAGEIAWRSRQLQAWAPIPLLLAADIEEGVGQRFGGATWFPPPMALGAIAQKDVSQAQEHARIMGATTAQEALALGLNWVLAPVTDVNNNPQNPVINVRAFGETPEVVQTLTQAFLRGAQGYPVLTTAKHFPGHGDTATDSHLDLPVLPHTPDRLAQIELPPFVTAIAAGVDTVMTAHLRIPAWDNDFPATLSPRILTGELRQRLGFTGLIVTDALIMAGVAKFASPEAVAIQAVQAGADVLLMPPDPEATIQAVLQAVKQGKIAPERIQAAVQRISRAKQKVRASRESAGLSTLTTLAQSEANDTVTAMLRNSQTGRGKLQPTPMGWNMVVVDDLLNSAFLTPQSPAIARPQTLGYQLQLVDRHTPITLPTMAQPTLLQCFIRGNPWRGAAGVTTITQTWFELLAQQGALQGLVVYGSPYALAEFLPKLPATVPYVFSYGQMPVAQAIALEQIFGS